MQSLRESGIKYPETRRGHDSIHCNHQIRRESPPIRQGDTGEMDVTRNNLGCRLNSYTQLHRLVKMTLGKRPNAAPRIGIRTRGFSRARSVTFHLCWRPIKIISGSMTNFCQLNRGRAGKEAEWGLESRCRLFPRDMYHENCSWEEISRRADRLVYGCS